MRVCFWGTYTVAEGYPVNRVLVKGLRLAGVEVVEAREQIWDGFLHSAMFATGPWPALRIVLRCVPAYIRLVWRFLCFRDHRFVVIGYAGYFDVILARALNSLRLRRQRRPLVLVAFISLYDTAVVDRQHLPARSWKAALLKKIDRTAFMAADLVLVDTEEHRDYFASLFDLPVAKFERSFVGEDDEVFHPEAAFFERESKGKLQILFFGTYVPLHGVEFIIEAADILRDESDLEFTLIGDGQQYPEMRALAESRELKRVRFVGNWVGTGDLVEYINSCDICLGIFGTTEKAARVIPYKVFDALAVGKPVVTRDSPAARELLDHEESALLCRPGDGGALAEAVRRLRDDDRLRGQLGTRGRERFLERGAPAAIGRQLLTTLESHRGR